MKGKVRSGYGLCWLAVLVFLLACSNSESEYKRAFAYEQAGKFVYAAEGYIDVCKEDADDDWCEKARERLDPVRVKAAEQLMAKNDFEKANKQLKLVASSPLAKPDTVSEAQAMSRSQLLKEGLVWQSQRYKDASGLPIMEKLATSKTRVKSLAKEWLNDNRPRLLFRKAEGVCSGSDNAKCSAIIKRLNRLHPGSRYVKKAAKLMESKCRSNFQAASRMSSRGDAVQAAATYDSVCVQCPGMRLCPPARISAARIRLQAARREAAQLRFGAAQTLYNEVVEKGDPQSQRIAKTQMGLAGFRMGLDYEAALRGSKREALSIMLRVSKAAGPAMAAARRWLSAEGPNLYLEDAQSACADGRDKRCAEACNSLIKAHPVSAQARTARLLLKKWQAFPFEQAKTAEAEGRLLASAEQLELGCARAPRSIDCRKGRSHGSRLREQFAEDAIRKGECLKAQTALRILSENGVDTKTKNDANNMLASELFATCLQADEQKKRVIAAGNSCLSLKEDCSKLVAAARPKENSEQKSALTKLLNDYKTGLATDRRTLKRIEDLLKTHQSLRAKEELAPSCFPPSFKGSKSPPPSPTNVVDRIFLGLPYALGGSSPPSPGRLLWGAIFFGALLGAAVGMQKPLALLKGKRVALGVLAGTLLLCFGLALLGQGSMKKAYLSVGISFGDGGKASTSK